MHFCPAYFTVCRKFLIFRLFPIFSQKSYNGSLTILSWGGVRGGISLALILAVANIPQLREYSSILIGYTFISVLLSGVVCGLGLPAVMNAFTIIQMKRLKALKDGINVYATK